MSVSKRRNKYTDGEKPTVNKIIQLMVKKKLEDMGRRDFGEILHCKRCKTDFCTKCQGKRKLADGTEYGCCPRCGAEIDDDDTVVVVTTEKENARKS